MTTTWKKIDVHINEALYHLRTAQVRCHPKTKTETKLRHAMKHLKRAIDMEHALRCIVRVLLIYPGIPLAMSLISDWAGWK